MARAIYADPKPESGRITFFCGRRCGRRVCSDVRREHAHRTIHRHSTRDIVRRNGAVYGAWKAESMVICETDVTLSLIIYECFEQLYFQNPEFGLYLVRFIATRFDHNLAQTEKAFRASAGTRSRIGACPSRTHVFSHGASNLGFECWRLRRAQRATGVSGSAPASKRRLLDGYWTVLGKSEALYKSLLFFRKIVALPRGLEPLFSP